MTETDILRREFLAAHTELSQLRRLERVADSDLVRLALSAWAALVEDHPDLAKMLEDLPAVISNQPRRMLRRLARANLKSARGLDALAGHWEAEGDPVRASSWRREAMVRRFKGWLLLQAAKDAMCVRE